MARAFTDGSTTDKLLGPSQTALTALTTLTCSLWIQPKAATPGAARRRIVDADDSNGTNGWFICTGVDGSWNVQFELVGSTNTRLESASGGLTTDVWTHVLVTWSGGLLSSSLTFYINGVSNSGTNGIDGSGHNTTAQAFSIGSDGAGATVGAWLAAFGCWNRVLTAGEIALLAGGLRPAGIASGLVSDVPISGASPEHDAAQNVDLTVTGTTVVADPPGLYLPVADADFWNVPIVQPQDFLVSIW